MVDYGDFEEVVYGQQPTAPAGGEVVARTRMPGKGEFIGVIVQRLGGNRMKVHTTDGKMRNCRVPGRFKRTLWLRPRDIVLITPWPDDDSKGDVIFKYHSSAINQLRKKGMLNNLKSEF